MLEINLPAYIFSILTDCLDHDHHFWGGWKSTRMLLFLRWIIKDSIFSKTPNHKPSSGCTGISKWLYLFCLTENVPFLSFMSKPFLCYLIVVLPPVCFFFPLQLVYLLVPSNLQFSILKRIENFVLCVVIFKSPAPSKTSDIILLKSLLSMLFTQHFE